MEYVALTALIMVCAVTSMMAIADSQKMVALERQLCVGCPARMSLIDLDAEEKRLAAQDKRNQEDENRLKEIREEIDYREERRKKEVRKASDQKLATKRKELEEQVPPVVVGNDKHATLLAIREEQQRRKDLAAADQLLENTSARDLSDDQLALMRSDLEERESSLTEEERQELDMLREEERVRKAKAEQDAIDAARDAEEELAWYWDIASWFTGARGFWEWLDFV